MTRTSFSHYWLFVKETTDHRCIPFTKFVKMMTFLFQCKSDQTYVYPVAHMHLNVNKQTNLNLSSIVSFSFSISSLKRVTSTNHITVCFQLTHFSFDNWICVLHLIIKLKIWNIMRCKVRSWNNGISCLSCYILNLTGDISNISNCRLGSHWQCISRNEYAANYEFLNVCSPVICFRVRFDLWNIKNIFRSFIKIETAQ